MMPILPRPSSTACSSAAPITSSVDGPTEPATSRRISASPQNSTQPELRLVATEFREKPRQSLENPQIPRSPYEVHIQLRIGLAHWEMGARGIKPGVIGS